MRYMKDENEKRKNTYKRFFFIIIILFTRGIWEGRHTQDMIFMGRLYTPVGLFTKNMIFFNFFCFFGWLA
ncbi:hypothetical protein QBC38DRAFT_481614 [Podospora fimiseda]|uniref:Uncharacterized protein n=1 Tax=Podospora fimiseda TaxID=252190 RepID=A0AAN7BMF5_9PEZI|nr:hypothetical protein QBC38DRAFT_481614 [Podospora fimiseda]